MRHLLNTSKTAAVIASAALVAGAALPYSAFADPDPTNPSVGGQTGKGTTDFMVKIQNPGQEYGGTSEPQYIDNITNEPTDSPTDEQGRPNAENPAYNPDTDVPADGVGNNLAFTVPSQINFIAKPDGSLEGPSPSINRIVNLSSFAIHVTSLKAEAKNSWNVVENARAVSTENAIDATLTSGTDALNLASYLGQKTAVGDESQWSMEYAGSGSDEVQVTATGHLNNVTKDLSETSNFASMHWYLTSG